MPDFIFCNSDNLVFVNKHFILNLYQHRNINTLCISVLRGVILMRVMLVEAARSGSGGLGDTLELDFEGRDSPVYLFFACVESCILHGVK